MKTHKWNHPDDWLQDVVQRHVGEGNVTELASILNSVMDTLDPDDIQDIFQSEMEADGYFQPLAGPIIGSLSREQVIELLEGVSIQCRDEESTAVLREALQTNVEDGTIPYEELVEVA